LQSFFYVFIYLSVPRDALEWNGRDAASKDKLLIGIDDVVFGMLLSDFKWNNRSALGYAALKIVASGMREALWPHSKRFNRSTLDEVKVRDDMYDAVFRAIDKGVYMFNPDMSLWKDEWEKQPSFNAPIGTEEG
jgi:hypothetical protein